MNLIRKIYHFLKFLYIKYKWKMQYFRQKDKKIFDICDRNSYNILFITNNHTGGTLQYEKNVIKNTNRCIILRWCNNNGIDIGFNLENIDTGEQTLQRISDLDAVFEMGFSEIIVNTLVDCNECINILNRVIQYKEKKHCKISYRVHDFHSVCLNCNLFVNGSYCELRCAEKKCGLMLNGKQLYITTWRKSWKYFFYAVDEIVCFCESSKQIMKKVYPEIADCKLLVKPHNMSYCSFTAIKDIDKLPLHIGIVGKCQVDFKGKYIVQELIKTYGDLIPITVIGSSRWRIGVSRSKVEYISSYKNKDLQNIIENTRVSCVVFPSLCPETFSYVVSEIMQMNLPIITFAYGAQQEKADEYEKGIVCQKKVDLFTCIERLLNESRIK